MSGPSPSLPDCYDIDVELPLVPQPRIADAVATPEADARLAKVNHLQMVCMCRYVMVVSSTGVSSRLKRMNLEIDPI